MLPAVEMFGEASSQGGLVEVVTVTKIQNQNKYKINKHINKQIYIK